MQDGFKLMPRTRSALWERVSQVECDAAALTNASFRDLLKDALKDKASIKKVQSEVNEQGKLEWLAYAYCNQCKGCSTKFMFEAKDGYFEHLRQGQYHEKSSAAARVANAERLAHLKPLQARQSTMFVILTSCWLTRSH